MIHECLETINECFEVSGTSVGVTSNNLQKVQNIPQEEHFLVPSTTKNGPTVSFYLLYVIIHSILHIIIH